MRVLPLENLGPGDLLGESEMPSGPILSWLGQAGFLIRMNDFRLMIDPYLSDSLAVKYRGRKFPHTRMIEPPVGPEAVTPLDAVLSTHAHTDHMDPDTLSVVAEKNPQCRFVVPRAARQTAAQRGLPPDRTEHVNAGEEISLGPGVTLQAIPSAHEELQCDEQGNHRFLGYVLQLGEVVVYHSGDCVPYPGLVDELATYGVQVALLPVNGRDAYRQENGVPGNFTFEEAKEICLQAGIPCMIGCHFGMFDFNTVDEAWLDRRIANLPAELQCVRPQAGQAYRLDSRRFNS